MNATSIVVLATPLRIRDTGDKCSCEHRANTGQFVEPPAGLVRAMPRVDLSIELQDLSFELAEQRTQGFETRTRNLGDALVLMIGDSVEQLLHAVATDGSDDTKLG